MAPFYPADGKEIQSDGNLTDISSEDAKNAYNCYNRACLKGLSSVQRVNSPSRLLYPLKQTKSRGDVSGFVRITWEEALEEISSKIKEHYSSDPTILGSNIATFTASGNYGALHGQSGAPGIIGSILNTRIMWTSLDMSLPVGLSKVLGSTTFPFLTGNELRDIKNAETLILWGSNMADAHVMGWKFVCDGKDEGTIKNVVSIDVMANTTSSKSDYFYAIRPGSDTALALGMIKLILDRTDYDNGTNTYKRKYVIENTVAPFLINTETYKFIRQSDIDGSSNSHFVLKTDTYAYTETSTNNSVTKEVNPSNIQIENVDLFFNGEIDGVNGKIKAATAFTLLKNHVAEWTAEKVEEYTNVSKENLEQLVSLYADNDKPSTIYLGFGTSHHYNSHHFGHAVATLAAITGNIGDKGRAVGNFFTRLPVVGTQDYMPTRANTVTAAPYIMPPQLAQDIKNGTNNVKVLMIASANPISNYVNSKTDYIDTIFDKERKNMDFIVVHDIEMTETARYADIVLPAAHWFEVDELFSGSKHPFVVLQEKVHAPMGEAKSDMDYARLLAAKLDEKIEGLNAKGHFCVNGNPANRYRTDLEIIEEKLRNVSGNRVTFDYLYKEKVARGRLPEDLYIAHKDTVLGVYTSGSLSGITSYGKLPSGRLDFYNESHFLFIEWEHRENVAKMVDDNVERLPTWVDCDEAWSGPTENQELIALRQKYPFIYMQEHSRWRVHTQWTEVPYLRELDPEPIVKINNQDASSLGINAGDMVRVYNDRGFGVFKAHLSNTLPQGIINVPKGWQRHLYSELRKYEDGTLGSYQDMTNPKFNPIGIDHVFYDARVNIEKIG